jgi:hypothetical protein
LEVVSVWFLVAMALLAAAGGTVLLIQDPRGSGLIALGCLFAVLARLVQSSAQTDRILHTLAQRPVSPATGDVNLVDRDGLWQEIMETADEPTPLRTALSPLEPPIQPVAEPQMERRWRQPGAELGQQARPAESRQERR